MSEPTVQDDDASPRGTRRVRADAQRNMQTLLVAAREVFAEAGVDAPVRDIADRAGVGIGTVYRHFPKRPDLIAAVFRQELDACAAAADRLLAEHPPFVALSLWMRELTALAETKRGLAQALRSGDPAYDFLPARRQEQLFPAMRRLFDAARANGDIRSTIDADDFLDAVAALCMSPGADRPGQALRRVMLIVDGLRVPEGGADPR